MIFSTKNQSMENYKHEYGWKKSKLGQLKKKTRSIVLSALHCCAIQMILIEVLGTSSDDGF